MTRHEIEQKHARAYKFRARGPQETRDRYLAALIAHVKIRDWAAAEELRLGKEQTEWTEAEAQAFGAALMARPHSPIGDPPPLVETFCIDMIPLGDQAEIDAMLLDMGRHGLAHMVTRRQQDPEKELAIMLTMLLPNGEIHIAPASRGTRLSILKAFAQVHGLLGFNVGTDVFIHRIDDDKATKTDAIIMHVGTHTSRWMCVRPYTVQAGVAHFEDPPPEDRNLRALPAGMTIGDDPYAEILCSVPLPTGKPS